MTNGQIIVKLLEMSSTRFYIRTSPPTLPSSLAMRVDFLSDHLEKLASLKISSEGLEFDVICSGGDEGDTGEGSLGDEGVIRDIYREGVLQSGNWSFQKTEDWFTVRLDGDDFYLFPVSEECLGEEIRAVEFEEEINGASLFYAGNIAQCKFLL